MQELIIGRPSTSLNSTTLSTATATAPLSIVPSMASVSDNIPSSPIQNNDEATSGDMWSTTYNRHIVPGDGDVSFPQSIVV